MKTEQILKNMKQHVGKEVLILKGHPWEGNKGKTIEAKIINEQPAMKVLLDNGTECFVYNPSHLFFIVAKLGHQLKH